MVFNQGSLSSSLFRLQHISLLHTFGRFPDPLVLFFVDKGKARWFERRYQLQKDSTPYSGYSVMLPVQQGFYVGHNRRYRSFYRRSQKQAGCSVSVNDMRMFALTIVMGLTHLITLLPAGQPNAKMTFIFTSFLGFVASYTSITMHNKTTRKISAHISMLLAATALALFMSLYTADNFKWVLYLMVFMMVPACLGEYMKCLMVWVHERIKSRAANWPMYPFKSPTLADLEAGQI